jgi:GT2 family glycosyltransferase
MSLIAEKTSGLTVWAIVLTHGGAEEITAACIDSLLRQDYPHLMVLLVDNASFDGSGNRLRNRYPAIQYLNTGGNFGYTGGNNRGIRLALDNGADFVLVLNNDTVLDPRCVSVLMESAHHADRLGAIVPKILYWDDPHRIWFAGGDYSYAKALGSHRGFLEVDDPDETPRLDDITFATGCCFLMPAKVAREMKGFRDDFFIYCEDAELSLRLTRAGYRLYYQPAARILHRESSRRVEPTPFQIFYRDRNRRRIATQHYSLAQRARFALWFYPTRVVRFVQYAVRGEWDRARAVAVAAVAR